MHPDVYIFNPTCDFAIANGSPNWHPNQLLRSMEEDLETLPVYLAEEGDIILLKEEPSSGFIERIDLIGIRNRRFLKMDDLKTWCSPLNSLQPWGWSPSMHKFFQPLKDHCSDRFKSLPVFNWQNEHKEICSRKFAAGLLKNLTTDLPHEFLIDKSQLPEVCLNRHDIESCIGKWGKIMIKAPWSSSGRGLQTITKIPVHEAVWQRTLSFIGTQGFVMAEPLLEKRLDVAFEFIVKNGTPLFIGKSYFITDGKGQYQGNYLNGLPELTDPELTGFIEKYDELIISSLLEQIGKSTIPEFYEGYLGIDALLFSDREKKLQINPCLEINLRYTMGILALKLERLISPRKKGILNLFYQPGKTFANYALEMTKKHPMVLIKNKLDSGFFPLTSITDTTNFGAFLLIN